MKIFVRNIWNFGGYLRDISSIFQPKENILLKFIPDFRHSASIWFYLAVFLKNKFKKMLMKIKFPEEGTELNYDKTQFA